MSVRINSRWNNSCRALYWSVIVFIVQSSNQLVFNGISCNACMLLSSFGGDVVRGIYYLLKAVSSRANIWRIHFCRLTNCLIASPVQSLWQHMCYHLQTKCQYQPFYLMFVYQRRHLATKSPGSPISDGFYQSCPVWRIYRTSNPALFDIWNPSLPKWSLTMRPACVNFPMCTITQVHL